MAHAGADPGIFDRGGGGVQTLTQKNATETFSRLVAK